MSVAQPLLLPDTDPEAYILVDPETGGRYLQPALGLFEGRKRRDTMTRTETATVELVKIAAIREDGFPQGVTAPCWMTCPACNTRMPAFTTEQTCDCGTRWTPTGYNASRREGSTSSVTGSVRRRHRSR